MSFLPLSAFSVFLAIAAVGFLFLVISLFFGEIFEHFDGGARPRLRSRRPGLLQHPHHQRLHHRVWRLRRRSRPTRGLEPWRRPASGSSAGSSWRRRSTSSPDFSTASRRSSESRSQDLVGQVGARRRGDTRRRRRPGALHDRRRARRQDCPRAGAGGDCREHAGHRRGSRRRNRRCQTSLRRGKARLMSYLSSAFVTPVLVADDPHRGLRGVVAHQPQLHQGVAERGRRAERPQAQAARRPRRRLPHGQGRRRPADSAAREGRVPAPQRDDDPARDQAGVHAARACRCRSRPSPT